MGLELGCLSWLCNQKCFLVFMKVLHFSFWATSQSSCCYDAILFRILWLVCANWKWISSAGGSCDLMMYVRMLALGVALNYERSLLKCPLRRTVSWFFNSTWGLLVHLFIWSCISMNPEMRFLESSGTYRVFSKLIGRLFFPLITTGPVPDIGSVILTPESLSSMPSTLLEYPSFSK